MITSIWKQTINRGFLTETTGGIPTCLPVHRGNAVFLGDSPHKIEKIACFRTRSQSFEWKPLEIACFLKGGLHACRLWWDLHECTSDHPFISQNRANRASQSRQAGHIFKTDRVFTGKKARFRKNKQA